VNASCQRIWIGLTVVNALLWIVFAFGSPAEADPRRAATLPVDPAVQRAEMISELSEIKQLLKVQNEILLGNKAKVDGAR